METVRLAFRSDILGFSYGRYAIPYSLAFHLARRICCYSKSLTSNDTGTTVSSEAASASALLVGAFRKWRYALLVNLASRSQARS